MRLKQGENETRKAYVMSMLMENPRASYAYLQRGLKDRFGHAMQQQLLRSYVEEFTVTLTVPAQTTVSDAKTSTSTGVVFE